MKRPMQIKMIFLVPILLLGFYTTLYSVIIVPPERNIAAEQFGQALGQTIGLLAQRIAVNKAQEEQACKIRKAYLNSFASAIKQPQLKKLIGKTHGQSNNFVLIILIMILLILLLLFYFKNKEAIGNIKNYIMR